ncbi:MAG: sodium-dependent transporter [Acidiferrobacterales bacterium]|nr:sodium-dependent transporter [Acidiferrobacterales bacterium]
MTKQNHKSSGLLTRWTSYWAFLLAAIGSSIGLGNIWKFPYEMGRHGGGTFLLVYIPCVLIVAFPLMLAEFMIGRRGRSNPVHSIVKIAKQDELSKLWQIIGWLGILTSFLIFSYYSVVASWILYYIMKSISGRFVDIPAEIVQNSFGALLHSSDQMLIWHTVFVLLVICVLARQVRSGLERAVRWLMPCFIALLVWLCLYASQVGDFESALLFVFSYDIAAIDTELIVSALSQALFSLSIGAGVLMMYGAYLSGGRPLLTGSAVILIFDTAVAVIMALLIFSIVFAFGMQPDAGPGLIFQTLPVAFAQMTEYSILWSTLFFSLLLVAALTSGFALLEPAIVWMIDQFSLKRRVAAWIVGLLAWGVGWLSVYSFDQYKFEFYYFDTLQENGFFDLFNILTTHVLMPTTALLIAIFTGWRFSKDKSKAALSVGIHFTYQVWWFCTRYVAPVLILLVLALVVHSRL